MRYPLSYWEAVIRGADKDARLGMTDYERDAVMYTLAALDELRAGNQAISLAAVYLAKAEIARRL